MSEETGSAAITREARRHALRELARRAGVTPEFFRSWRIEFGNQETTVYLQPGTQKRIRFQNAPATLWRELSAGVFRTARALWMRTPRNSVAAFVPELVIPFVHQTSRAVRPLFAAADGDLLTSVTDPRGTLNFEYDALHRLRKKRHGTTVVAEFTYDGTWEDNAIGRLITETDGSVGTADKTDYTYDALGQVKNANRTVPGTTYNMSYTYDLLGNLDTINYPSASGTRRKVQYAYKTTGEPDKVSDITSTAFDYVTSTTYSSLGPIQALNLPNSVSTTLQWTKRGLVDSILTAKSGGPTHLNLDYTYYANGQIFEIINVMNILKSEKFTYDELLRLATAQRGPDTDIQRKYSYDYDRFGNRWGQNVVAGSGLSRQDTYNYGNNRVTSPGLTYDGSGNLTATASRPRPETLRLHSSRTR